jgi:lysophospholipase L1-like esterase
MGKWLIRITAVLVLAVLAAAAGFAGAEAYSRRTSRADMEWVIAPIHQPDPDLGYSGLPNAEGIDSVKINGHYQFRVNLKLNRFGFREVPGDEHARGPRCLVILGDSLAFGIGMNARDTFASLLQNQLRDTRVFNLGYSGYGPHQTLRFLELERERKILDGCRETVAYYLGVEDNFWRALGRANWGLSAPSYGLVNGEVTYRRPNYPEWVNALNNRVQRLQIGPPLVKWLVGYGKEVPAEEHEIYRKIFLKMGRLLRERYGADFHVLYGTQGRDPKLPEFRKLEGEGLDVKYFEGYMLAEGYPLAKILPDLYLGDRTHFNAAGHRAVAKILLATRLGPWLRSVDGR